MTHAPSDRRETLEQALKERDRLTRAYRAAKRAQYEKAFEQEPLLRDFANDIKKCGLKHANEIILLCEQFDKFVPNDLPSRAIALEIVSRRIVRIREGAGLASFDDALPWEADDVFQIAKRILT